MDQTPIQKKIYNIAYNLVDDVFEKPQDVTWKEDPVTFREFIESDLHMSFPAWSERQYAVADFMLGQYPKKIFDNENNIAILCFGKGAGKDAISALIILYIVYVLLCLENPQKFFGSPEGEAIDMLNVAANADQAANVF
jgi:hypothetical protein